MEVKEPSAKYLAGFAYKQTEAGVIPNDWGAIPLGRLGVWKGGATPSMRNSAFWEQGTIPWISSGDVKRPLLDDAPMKITKYAVQNSSTTLLPPHSVVIVTRSGILRKYLPVAKNTIPLAINQDIKALISTNDHVPDYLLHLVQWSGPRILATCLKAGTTVESIEFRWLKSFIVPLPSTKTEQEVIAEALSDADTLIESLEQLLVKKRQVKLGAMQELLTGKKRLPGFGGAEMTRTEVGKLPSDWRVVAIGLIAQVKTGPFGSSLHERDYVAHGTPIITVEHLGESGINHVNLPMVSEADCKRLNAYSLEQGDVVFSRVGSIDRNALVTAAESGWLFSGRLLRLRAHSGVIDTRYLSYLFHSEPFKQRVRTVAVGQTMASLNTKILKGVLVSLPPLPEQGAIAATLTDMDSEISALDVKLTKARQIKQGMAQQLLTGRIRLV